MTNGTNSATTGSKLSKPLQWKAERAAFLQSQNEGHEPCKGSFQRGEQWRRTMLVAEALMAARCGLRIDHLTERVNDRMGTGYTDRTIRRDVDFLAAMGLAERNTSGGAIFTYWFPRHHALARMVLSVVGMQEIEHRPRKSDQVEDKVEAIALRGALDQIPPPWEMDAVQMRAATEAARILAVIVYDNCYANAMLIFNIGSGWQLQRLGRDAPSLGDFQIAITIAEKAMAAGEALREMVAGSSDSWEGE